MTDWPSQMDINGGTSNCLTSRGNRDGSRKRRKRVRWIQKDGRSEKENHSIIYQLYCVSTFTVKSIASRYVAVRSNAMKCTNSSTECSSPKDLWLYSLTTSSSTLSHRHYRNFFTQQSKELQLGIRCQLCWFTHCILCTKLPAVQDQYRTLCQISNEQMN